MKVLKTNNIIKVYGDKRTTNTVNALNGITLEIEKGEFIGIMGASGSGKTTLLNILCGMLNPTAGNVEINETIISTMEKNSLAIFRRRNIGYVFQDYKLLDSLTLRENIMLPLVLDRLNPSHINERAIEIIRLLGLEEASNQYPYQTSGGQKQRAAIGRALIKEPSIIFADEPTGNLDTKASNTIMESFVRINKEKDQTIIMVTHDPKAASYCDRILFIKDGRVNLEIVKKSGQKQFFEQILDCIAVIGGDENDG